MADPKRIAVDCITLHHRYRGNLHTGGARLSDALSDSQTDYIELHDVQITPAGGNKPSIECSKITLRKESILIAIPQGAYEAPTVRLSRFQKKHRHGVVVVLPGLILSGVIQLSRISASWSTLKESGEIQRFMGLTDVTVHNGVFCLTPPTCPVVIVQRDAVEAIELTSTPLVTPPSSSNESLADNES